MEVREGRREIQSRGPVLSGFLLGVVSLLSQDLKSRDGAWAPEPPAEICLKPTTPLTDSTWSSARLRAL